MNCFQISFRLPAFKRGFHLITHLVEAQLKDVKSIQLGTAHIFIKHTSASISINENADPTVREDLEKHFNVLAPENAPYYKHTYEGSDDMPAHIKSALLGNSLTIPITEGKFNLGVWQGIYLCEHRNQASGRHLVVTVMGV